MVTYLKKSIQTNINEWMVNHPNRFSAVKMSDISKPEIEILAYSDDELETIVDYADKNDLFFMNSSTNERLTNVY